MTLLYRRTLAVSFALLGAAPLGACGTSGEAPAPDTSATAGAEAAAVEAKAATEARRKQRLAAFYGDDDMPDGKAAKTMRDEGDDGPAAPVQAPHDTLPAPPGPSAGGIVHMPAPPIPPVR